MSKIGKYIYGIIPRLRSGQVNPNRELSFVLNDERVYTISHQDISAVVSDAEIVDYTHLPKYAVARFLIRHQKVIENIMESFTIIPVLLGTFVCDEDEIKYILAKASPTIKDIFNKVCAKIEIDIAVTWSDFNAILKEAGEEKEIKEFRERLAAIPRVITVDEQMKVGVMVKKALDRKREICAEEIQNALETISRDYKVHELMDDKMVINTAFLIDKVRRQDFDGEVEKLNAGFQEKLNFRCIGPLPPYSFYTLEIKKMDFREVDWARKKFGLNNTATKEEIKRAHRALAISSHPDKNLNTSDSEKAFNETTRAYKTLADYCRACDEAGQKESYSFDEEEFKGNAILVKVRG